MAKGNRSSGVDKFDAEVGQSITIRWELDCTAQGTNVLPIAQGTGDTRTIVQRETPGLNPLKGAPRKNSLRATFTVTFTPAGDSATARPDGFPDPTTIVANGGRDGSGRSINQRENGPHNWTEYKGNKVPAGDFDVYQASFRTEAVGVYRFKVEVAEVVGGSVGTARVEADVTVTVSPSTLTENRVDLLEIIDVWFPSSSSAPRPPKDTTLADADNETKGLIELAGWTKDPKDYIGTFTIPQFEPRDKPIYDTDPAWSGDSKGDKAFTRDKGTVTATSPGRLNYAIKNFYNGGAAGQGGVVQRQKKEFDAWLAAKAKEAGITANEYKVRNKLIGPFPAPVATSCNDVMNVILKIWGTETKVDIGTMAESVEAAERPDRYAKKNVERHELKVHNARQAVNEAAAALKEAEKRAQKSPTEANQQAVTEARAAKTKADAALTTAEAGLVKARSDKKAVDKVVAAKRAEQRADEAVRQAKAKAKQADDTVKLRAEQVKKAEDKVEAARVEAAKPPRSAGKDFNVTQAERERDAYQTALEDAQERAKKVHGEVKTAEGHRDEAVAARQAAAANMPKKFEPYLYYKFAAREYADEKGARPKPGDIIFLSQNEKELNQFAHVCILVSAGPTTWITADGGGGLLPDQAAGISDKPIQWFDFKLNGVIVAKVPGILSTTDLKVKPIHGWVNLDELSNPNYGADRKRQKPVNWHSLPWRAAHPGKASGPAGAKAKKSTY